MRTSRLFLVIFFIALPLVTAVNLLAQIPRPYDEYFALFTLGSTGMAEHYFPKDDSNILPGEGISWFVGIYNHMSLVQLVKVKFKFLNSTMNGPDQPSKTPSLREPFYEETRLVLSNETWVFPISWSVFNASETYDGSSVHSLMFNGEILTQHVDVSATNGFNYRIVIELWVYDGATGDFSFIWNADGEERVAWNQIWFNMTRVSLLPT